MTSPGVIPAFDPGIYCESAFGTGVEGFAVNKFALQASEKTPTIALSNA
jgi:hypothetical protein